MEQDDKYQNVRVSVLLPHQMHNALCELLVGDDSESFSEFFRRALRKEIKRAKIRDIKEFVDELDKDESKMILDEIKKRGTD